MKNQPNNKILANNKQSTFSYNVEENFIAGIKLTGPEVKSAKSSSVNLKGAYISIRQNSKGKIEAWLIGSTIAPYQKAGYAQKADYNRSRDRKLLLTTTQLRYLQGKTQQKGLTIVPLSLYTSNGLIKLNIAIAKGASKQDKREKIKKRETDRSLKQLLKN